MLSAGAHKNAVGHVVGRYLVCDEFSSGGMATVHLGRLLGPVGFSRIVAIKRLHPHFAKEPGFVAMLVDEARLAARVRHPNVVPTLDVVSTDEELLLVLEYVHGESLARLWKTVVAGGASVPAAIAASIVGGALHGLHAAHEATTERGDPLCLVHRDVSPQNILVGVDGVTRVFDFGVAKAIGRVQTTHQGQTKGKLAYMSPEQASSSPVDRRTDVYAAAVVLWEALTGQRLFEGDDPRSLLGQVLARRVEAPSRIVPAVPAAIDDVVLRGLARDPEERFATALDMAMALERASAPTPPREIGAWVESVAGSGLRARAEIVARIERGEDGDAENGASRAERGDRSTVETAAAPVVSRSDILTNADERAASNAREGSTRSARRSRIRWGAVMAVCVLGAAAIGYAMPRGARTWASPPPPAPPPPPATPAPPPEAPAPPASATIAPSPPTSASAAPARALPPRPRPVAPRAPPAAPSCDPPFTVDADGFRHPRPECLHLSPVKR